MRDRLQFPILNRTGKIQSPIDSSTQSATKASLFTHIRNNSGKASFVGQSPNQFRESALCYIYKMAANLDYVILYVNVCVYILFIFEIRRPMLYDGFLLLWPFGKGCRPGGLCEVIKYIYQLIKKSTEEAFCLVFCKELKIERNLWHHLELEIFKSLKMQQVNSISQSCFKKPYVMTLET